MTDVRQPTVLVLAAGRGERFAASGGTTHKLQSLLAGKPVLQHVLDAVAASGLPHHVVHADPSRPGMGDSIAAGVRATADAAGWLVLPGDLPLVQPATLRAVAQALQQHVVVVPVYQGERGHPVGFAAACGAQLMALQGEHGAAPVVKAHDAMLLAVDDVGAVTDVDTLDDLRAAERSLLGARTPAARPRFKCITDTPSGLELVLDAGEGFIPLWDRNVTLRWRFNEKSIGRTSDPAVARQQVRGLLRDALNEWGDAAPVRLAEYEGELWDFEIVVRKTKDCDDSGCTLATAFFPDDRRNKLVIYPTLLKEARDEQVLTLAHELGHIFGLRHYFANLTETDSPSVVFGAHRKFTIMNYGSESRLTEADRLDLKRLYDAVWSGELTHVKDIPIRQVKPFHQRAAPPA